MTVTTTLHYLRCDLTYPPCPRHSTDADSYLNLSTDVSNMIILEYHEIRFLVIIFDDIALDPHINVRVYYLLVKGGAERQCRLES